MPRGSFSFPGLTFFKPLPKVIVLIRICGFAWNFATINTKLSHKARRKLGFEVAKERKDFSLES